MKELRHLDLSWARFSGSIPHQLGNLTKLISLKLSSASLSAKNLWWLTSLPSLNYLDMSEVNLSMAGHDWVHVMNKFPSLVELYLPDCGLSYISPTLPSVNFTSLLVLDLSFNNFKSTIPNWIANISSLEILNLARSQLNGNIPAALGGLSSLQELSLRRNQLNGTIPTTLGQLSNLYWLDLSNNSLTGKVSESVFENLKKLSYLYLSSNSLVFDPHSDWAPPFQLSYLDLGSCHLGPRFPPWLRTQKYVGLLDLSNTTISGIIPTWFWDLTPQLFWLKLSNNQIFGQLPNPLKMWPQSLYIDLSSNHFSGPVPCILNGARVLDLSNNQFSGPIPPNFTSTMPYLEFFSAKGNQISGTIPSSIEGMNSLTALDLSQNNIGGIIPLSLGNCVALKAVDLSKNWLSGEIPRSLGQLDRLQTMHLSNNKLSGKIPLSLKKCAALETMDLGYNNLSGHIPTWISKSFPTLRILRLRSNMFIGNIPPQLLNLTSLQLLDVAQNCLSGSIPQSFENLVAMKNEQKINLVLSYGGMGTISYYKENLLVSVKGLVLEYTATVSLVTCIDLSRNNLSGEIPEGLTGLLGLRALNLSGNHLTGKIPDKIGKLALLESLDFSENQLSGTIPLSMSNLTFLSCLNLSFNNLWGKIPSGNQLQTFQDPSIYMGNNGLCGPPLLDKCVSDETPPGLGDVENDEEEDEMSWFYSGLGPGFAVGFWALCGILVLKRSWRIVYYRFFDEMKDRLCFNCHCTWSLQTAYSILKRLQRFGQIFKNDSLKDLTSKKMIGLGKQFNGLYYFVPPVKSAPTSFSVTYHLILLQTFHENIVSQPEIFEYIIDSPPLATPPISSSSEITHSSSPSSSISPAALPLCRRYWKVSGCFDSERKALTTFRKALNDSFNILSSWDDDASDCCNWRGITCHNITGFVLKLDLHVKDSRLGLGGRIDPALVQLKHLQFLDLSSNAFNGAPIPDFLGSMKELRHLNLSDAGFSGRIPRQLGNLTKLISLKLSSPSLSAKNLWWLTSLPSLTYLDMSFVNLSMASHDWVHVMNMSPSLVELYLWNCGLSYISPTLPSVNFTSVRVLDLSENNFNSSIPNWIANISSLVSLYLLGNNFHGDQVPYRFSQLPNLEELGLGSTDDNLRVDWSEFLEGSWRKLKILHLSFSQLHGGIPNSIGNIISLESLSLSFSENITGSIPRAITKLINLEILSLYGYQMHAAIPDCLYELKNLKSLSLSDCMLTGPIPAARLGGLSSLEELDLSGNQLNGNIPAALGGLSSLLYLSLRGNQLNGNIPASLGGLSSLEELILSGNQLNGNIPAALGGLSSLEYLDLSVNQLNGNIPAALGGLSSLLYLSLRGNQLNGNIPASLGGLSSLEELFLSRNQLNGNIPAALGGLSSLRDLSLRGNQLNGTIPTTLGQLSNLYWLDLSHNSLTGNVSESVEVLNFVFQFFGF
ncbi:receptor-like protein EIX1 [Magnolia sinica]|uniref:receptor-like protein EIX1 n=1 Tax=Magnolia sinica TaxID=86752 RepID=UPI0026596A33|nr:receptor-like protein EIX1 [Magnolia sinica]